MLQVGYHDHGDCHRPSTSNRLRFALILTVVILAVELAGGIAANSLALLSDAGHVLTDIIALGLAWFASRQAERPATGTRTFGYHRAGILAALANAITLVVVAAVVLWESYKRLLSPEAVESELMLGVAFVGLLVNVLVMRYLQANDGENLNVRSALLHVVGDTAASGAVILGGIIILLTGWYLVDPILSVLIALIIAVGAWSVIRETVNILMEGAPKGLHFERLLADLRDVPGVQDVHDLHVWSLAAGLHALSGHVLVADRSISESDGILRQVNDLLSCRYGINHTTLQLEHCKCGLICALCDNRSVVG